MYDLIRAAMNIHRFAFTLITALALRHYGWAADGGRGAPPLQEAKPAAPRPRASGQVYHVRAGGPHNYVAITNAAGSNLVSIAWSDWKEGDAMFRITNREPHAVLLWNVRVQVKAKNGGTDGLGWETVYDEYPTATPNANGSRYLPGGIGELRVPPPDEVPWRICVLYSIDWKDEGKTFSGNYEAISQAFATSMPPLPPAPTDPKPTAAPR